MGGKGLATAGSKKGKGVKIWPPCGIWARRVGDPLGPEEAGVGRKKDFAAEWRAKIRSPVGAQFIMSKEGEGVKIWPPCGIWARRVGDPLGSEEAGVGRKKRFCRQMEGKD